jgi:hypothetical protein
VNGDEMRYAAQKRTKKNPKVKKNMSDKVFEAQKFGHERR